MFSNLAHDENPQCNTKHASSKKTFPIACSQNLKFQLKRQIAYAPVNINPGTPSPGPECGISEGFATLRLLIGESGH